MMRPLAKNFYLERLNLNSNLKRGSCPVAVATLLMRQESGVYCDKAQCRLATRTAQQSDISMEQEVRLPRTWCGGVQLTSSNDDCCTAASVGLSALLTRCAFSYSFTLYNLFISFYLFGKELMDGSLWVKFKKWSIATGGAYSAIHYEPLVNFTRICWSILHRLLSL